MAKDNEIQYKWKDRKRIIFGLPWSFTRYRLTDEKLIVKTGFFSTNEDETRLYRIMDVTLKRSLGERLWGLGTIHMCSAYKSTAEFDIKRIKKSESIKNLISDMVESERERKRVSGREFMGSEDAYDDDADL